MSVVGIIANPAAGKDIRRLIAYGTVFDNNEKIGITRRIILGLSAAGVQKVWYMPESIGIVPRALEGIRKVDRPEMEVCELPLHPLFTAEDSLRAAQLLAKLQVHCIITLGGDGTNRLVAKGCGEIPLMPVSTGTNNVFPKVVEGTIAGLAAGYIANGKSRSSKSVRRSKRILIRRARADFDLALIDVAILQDRFIGSRAVWNVSDLKRLFLTQAQSHHIGLSAIGASVRTVRPADRFGLELLFSPHGEERLIPIGPGLIRRVAIDSWRNIPIGEEIPLARGDGLIAIDGEREIEVSSHEDFSLQLDFQGPWVIEPEEVLQPDLLAQ